MSLMIRTAADPMTVARQVREDIRVVDPRQPVAQVQTLADARAAMLATPRATTAIIALFALLALLVTAAGIGGVLALLVTQRSKEIALRVALGARRGEILSLILRQGLALVLVGLSIGAAGALALAHLMGSFLYEIRPTDPFTFTGVALVLAAVA